MRKIRHGRLAVVAGLLAADIVATNSPRQQLLNFERIRKACIPELSVAAAILAAREPWHPARRAWRTSARELGTSSAGPGGKMRALNGSQDGCRYSAADNLGKLTSGSSGAGEVRARNLPILPLGWGIPKFGQVIILEDTLDRLSSSISRELARLSDRGMPVAYKASLIMNDLGFAICELAGRRQKSGTRR